MSLVHDTDFGYVLFHPNLVGHISYGTTLTPWMKDFASPIYIFGLVLRYRKTNNKILHTILYEML